jgi:hypothetical protein
MLRSRAAYSWRRRQINLITETRDAIYADAITQARWLAYVSQLRQLTMFGATNAQELIVIFPTVKTDSCRPIT